MKKMTAAQMGRAIERGELDPVDLAESYFAAIEAHEFSERIYARLTKDRAYGEAVPHATAPKLGCAGLWMAFR